MSVVHAGQVAGILTRTAGQISLTYENGWRSQPSATPLSVSMPLAAERHTNRVVEPWLWGVLPDNQEVLNRWGREFHTSIRHPMGLLASVGRDLPGGFQIVDEPDEAVTGGVEWLSDSQVAELLRQVRADQTAWLGPSAQGRWSLAGAQAKIALRFEGGRWGRPYGPVATTHILKPAIAGLDDHDLNEHLCLRAARLAGLRVVRSEIAMFADERAIVVERYDRLPGPMGRTTRVHQEDLCQALGVDPGRKYEADGGPTVHDIGRLLRVHVPGRAAREDFADALAFNWLICAPDAHAKNYALLLSGPQVRFAPLYDIASALAYSDMYAPKLKMAMRVGGQYLFAQVRRDHWLKVAEQLQLDGDRLAGRVAEIASRTPDAFAQACADPAVAELVSELPDRLRERVSRHVDRCAARL